MVRCSVCMGAPFRKCAKGCRVRRMLRKRAGTPQALRGDAPGSSGRKRNTMRPGRVIGRAEHRAIQRRALWLAPAGRVRGFTLLEVLIALVVVLIGVLGI